MMFNKKLNALLFGEMKIIMENLYFLIQHGGQFGVDSSIIITKHSVNLILNKIE
jgi:hypothetical protein